MTHRHGLRLAVTLCLILPALLPATGSTITDNGDGTKTYYEGFETEPVNQPPDEAWYDFDDAGTPGASVVTTSSPNTGARSLLVQVGSATYMAGIENTIADADLCEGPNQALAFNFKFPDWGNNAAVFNAGRVSDSFGVTGSPFNNIDFRVTRSGVVTPSFALSAHIRGQSAAEFTQAVGTVTINTVYTVTISNVQCTGGNAHATYTVVGGALNAGPNVLTASDAFTSTAIELDAVSIGSTSATAAQGGYRLDEVTFFSVPVEDADGDGVEDADDNCPTDINPAQEDEDADGIGDACEVDSDGDGVIDDEDNCPALSNADQQDLDANGVGDACQEGIVTDTFFDEDFEGETVGSVADAGWYVAGGNCGNRIVVSDNYAHTGTRSGVSSGSGDPAPHTNGPSGDCQADWIIDTGTWDPCVSDVEVSFWFLRDFDTTAGGADIFHVGLKQGSPPSSQVGSLGLLDQSGPTYTGGTAVEQGGGHGSFASTVDIDGSIVLDTWYQMTISEIDCAAAMATVSIPALGINQVVLDDSGSFDLDRFSIWTSIVAGSANQPQYYIDDFQVTVAGLAYQDSVLVPQLAGFDVDDLGKNAVFTRALSGADPLFSHMQTFQPYSSPNDPAHNLPEIASDDDECLIGDGVSIISAGSDPLHDVSWDAAISWWGCPPGNEDQVNDLFINDVGFDTYAPGCDFCDEEIAESDDVISLGLGGELADVRGYPYTFTQKYGSANCPGPDFGEDCNSVLTLWAASERTSGKLGVLAYSHNNDADDSFDSEVIQYTVEGETADQICTWVGADGFDWLAAADAEALPKGYRIIVDDPGGRSAIAGSDTIEDPSITVIEEVTGPAKGFGATGIGCAGWLIAYTVPSESEFELVQLVCTMTIEQTSRHSGCNEGQVVAEVQVAGELADTRGITLVQRGDYVDRDVYFGAYVEDDHIQYFSFEQGVLFLTCTSPLPPGTFFQMEMDQGAQSLWVAMQGASGGVYRYDVTPCTTIVDAPYSPPNDIGCHACDADGDGFQDGDDAQPNNDDCNDNGINDGEEESVTCTNSHGETVTCTSTGSCEVTGGPDTGGRQPGDPFFPGVDLTGTSAALGISVESLCGFLAILFALALAAAFYPISRWLALSGFLVGLVVAYLFNCLPLWVLILIFVVGAGVGVTFFTRRGA